MYGKDRAAEFLASHRNESSRSMLENLREDIRRFADGAEPFDDITMLLLRRE